MRTLKTVIFLSLMLSAGLARADAHGARDRHVADNAPHQPQPPHSQPAPPPGHWGHGNVHTFPSRDWYHWHQGYWHHGWYGPRFGWWWVVPGGWWFYYPQPLYPYPNPYVPPGFVPPPSDAQPATQYWYYCPASKTYYPYVSECPEGWQQVQPTPPDLDKQEDKED